MQDVNPFSLPTPAPLSYVLDGTGHTPTGRSLSWSIDSDSQMFTNDATFWQDVSTFICSSPQTSFDYRSEDLASAMSPITPPEDCSNPKAIEGGENGSSPSGQHQQPQQIRGQTLELLMKRRAQNRASQRAYRDRRDQHVRDLETQFEAMVKRNADLTRENDELCVAHERLRAELEAWRAERERERGERERFEGERTTLLQQLREEKEQMVVEMEKRRRPTDGGREGRGLRTAGGGGDDEGGAGAAFWTADALAEGCLQEVLGVGSARKWQDDDFHDDREHTELENEKGNEKGGGSGGGRDAAGLMVRVMVCKRCFGPALMTKCEN